MDEIGPILENKMLIFAVPVKGLKMKTLTAFRQKLPATSVARVVKNTLMERSLCCLDLTRFLVSCLICAGLALRNGALSRIY